MDWRFNTETARNMNALCSMNLLIKRVSKIEKLLYALLGIGGGILIALIGGIVALIWRLGG